MTRNSESFPTDLVAEQAWLRRLARHLVQDSAVADDLVQDANLSALDDRTRRGPLKPWLAQVLRNLWRMRVRSAVRRRGREQSVVDPGTAAPPADLLLDRLELVHLLSKALLALAEPYRSTILLRYHEGLSSAEIARRHGIEAATVRWRLKYGLDELRRHFDQLADGDRRAWLLPMAQIVRHSPAVPLAQGALAMAAALVMAAAPPPLPPAQPVVHALLSAPAVEPMRPAAAHTVAARRPREAITIHRAENAPALRPRGWRRSQASAEEAQAAAPEPVAVRARLGLAAVADDQFLLTAPGTSMTVRVDDDSLVGAPVQMTRYGRTLRGRAFGAAIDVDCSDDAVVGLTGGAPINLHISEEAGEITVRGLYAGNLTHFRAGPSRIEGYIGPRELWLAADGEEYRGSGAEYRSGGGVIGFGAPLLVRIPHRLAHRNRGELAASLTILLASYAGPSAPAAPARDDTARAVGDRMMMTSWFETRSAPPPLAARMPPAVNRTPAPRPAEPLSPFSLLPDRSASAGSHAAHTTGSAAGQRSGDFAPAAHASPVAPPASAPSVGHTVRH